MRNDLVINTVEETKNQVILIQTLLKDVMQEGQHYGVIKGCGNKPTLLKAGAEKLCLIFKLSASFDVIQKDFDEKHREYQVKCTLTHIETGNMIAQGVGSASTMESKYRYRKDWNSGQRVENQDIADVYNTVLKIAKKRAYVDASITATAASDIFTQDIEDMNFDKEEPKTPEKVVEMNKVITRGIEKGLFSQIDKEMTIKVFTGNKYTDYLDLPLNIAIQVYDKLVALGNLKAQEDKNV